MYCIALHDTETEDIVGYVTPIEKMNMPEFDDLMRVSWKRFLNETDLDQQYIEEFEEWHNKNFDIKIEYVIVDFIQL